jgi:hypothetical protein
MVSEAKLDFAYKYPFSQEAKEVVAELKVESVDPHYLQEGIAQIKSALKEGKILRERVMGISELKYKYIMGYVYARMLVSALGDGYSISRFASAEAELAGELLATDTVELTKIANELGLSVRKEDGSFAIAFEQFVSVPKKDGSMMLINQNLSNGVVSVDEFQLRKLVQGAIEKEIRSRLPIERRSLPKEILDAAKELAPQGQRVALKSRPGSYSWIEKLLETPIADVRHRSVNLIFAPYLVNVKGLDVESATKQIVDYIEKCKAINPNTKINESYIKYQCAYAKKKGMRPLSMVRAKDLLREVAEFG